MKALGCSGSLLAYLALQWNGLVGRVFSHF